MYTIVDIETTGNGLKGNKITEISIFKFNGEEIEAEFTSLVNPECEIPYFITGLTGIDNQMVRKAPKFKELAPRIQEFTEGCVFVAHSVNFDYNVIKSEFRALGVDFSRKKLCTVRLSRKIFPGLHSYSLGKLCRSLDIVLRDRHRARGDARATVEIFSRIMRSEGASSLIKSFLNARSQEATLPPALPKEIYDALPLKPGIYFFRNSRGEVIYVGKAKNIRKRVLSHFYDRAEKEIRMCRETTDIDFELSGSELLALLMESAAIKHHYPRYNQSQKKESTEYGLFSYQDRRGVLHLAFSKARMLPHPILHFYSLSDCRLYLEQLCIKFGLCAKYCHLQEPVAHCSHFRVPQCGGVCREEEEVSSYNAKVSSAIEEVSKLREDLFICEEGREPGETGVIMLRDGNHFEYGFIPKDHPIHSAEDLTAFCRLQRYTPESRRILQSYTIQNPSRLKPIPAFFVR